MNGFMFGFLLILGAVVCLVLLGLTLLCVLLIIKKMANLEYKKHGV